MIQKMKDKGMSELQACESIGLGRSSFQYRPLTGMTKDIETRIRIKILARRHPRYGYRRITALLRRQGMKINAKRVFRTWQEEGLSLPRKRPRRPRLWELWERPHEATKPNSVWSYDFVFDRTVGKQVLKMLVLVDEYTRECLAIRVGSSMDSVKLAEILAEVIKKRGAPEYIRSDNGPEFIAEGLRRWLLSKGIRPLHIEPGSPWQNGYVESLNGKLRDECLNRELFWDVREAQVIVDDWRREYNQYRPHSSLGYRTPAEMGRKNVDKDGSRTGNPLMRESRN